MTTNVDVKRSWTLVVSSSATPPDGVASGSTPFLLDTYGSSSEWCNSTSVPPDTFRGHPTKQEGEQFDRPLAAGVNIYMRALGAGASTTAVVSNNLEMFGA